MVEGRELVSVLMAWVFQLGFIALIIFAVYRINTVHRQLEELRTDLKAVRERVEGMPPIQ